MNKKKYVVYVVSADDIDYGKVGDGEEDELGFAEIRDLAINSFKTNKLKRITKFLLSQLNSSDVDVSFYFVCDQIEEVVLYF